MKPEGYVEQTEDTDTADTGNNTDTPVE
jgi:hypothetical protein